MIRELCRRRAALIGALFVSLPSALCLRLGEPGAEEGLAAVGLTQSAIDALVEDDAHVLDSADEGSTADDQEDAMIQLLEDVDASVRKAAEAVKQPPPAAVVSVEGPDGHAEPKQAARTTPAPAAVEADGAGAAASTVMPAASAAANAAHPAETSAKPPVEADPHLANDEQVLEETVQAARARAAVSRAAAQGSEAPTEWKKVVDLEEEQLRKESPELVKARKKAMEKVSELASVQLEAEESVKELSDKAAEQAREVQETKKRRDADEAEAKAAKKFAEFAEEAVQRAQKAAEDEQKHLQEDAAHQTEAEEKFKKAKQATAEAAGVWKEAGDAAKEAARGVPCSKGIHQQLQQVPKTVPKQPIAKEPDTTTSDTSGDTQAQPSGCGCAPAPPPAPPAESPCGIVPGPPPKITMMVKEHPQPRYWTYSIAMAIAVGLLLKALGCCYVRW